MVSTTNILRLLLSILLFLASATSECVSESSMQKIHKDWMTLHGRVYKNLEEYTKRFIIFNDNYQRIEKFNAGNKDDDDDRIELEVNQFADMTNDEFLGSMTYKNSKKSNQAVSGTTSNTFIYANETDIPLEKDWRDEGAITPIKNQGNCGCCWAFSAVAATESINMIKKNELIALSEQQLVDCDVGGENFGCSGGEIEAAFEFIIKNKGIASEEAYPYTGIEGDCKNNNMTSNIATTISSYERVPSNNETALLLALVNQPVSVAIDASGFKFQFYRRGIISGYCNTRLNHGVLAVGYGISMFGTKYWVLKNSWGEKWGDEGFFMMRRDIAKKEGMCGIAIQGSYPIID